MNEETAAAFQREGNPAFVATESTADETAAASQAEGENKDGDTQSAEGEKKENTQTEEKDIPFHEHPRWKKREEEWNERFNSQETRHADDLKSIREEFAGARKDNAEQTKIPAWFGGTQEQWNAYRSDRDAELKQIEDRAIERAEKNFETKAGAGDKAVKEATEFLNTEVAAIEADATLNPTGAKIDREKLLKVVLDNELIDSKGRWNYRAGFKILNGTPAAAPVIKKPDEKTQEKKKIAASTTSGESGGEKKDDAIATSDTFKKNRPW